MKEKNHSMGKKRKVPSMVEVYGNYQPSKKAHVENDINNDNDQGPLSSVITSTQQEGVKVKVYKSMCCCLLHPHVH
jgi:hypothetical protein